jgi:hypothetical protein
LKAIGEKRAGREKRSGLGKKRAGGGLGERRNSWRERLIVAVFSSQGSAHVEPIAVDATWVPWPWAQLVEEEMTPW